MTAAAQAARNRCPVCDAYVTQIDAVIHRCTDCDQRAYLGRTLTSPTLSGRARVNRLEDMVDAFGQARVNAWFDDIADDLMAVPA